ncbi:Extragenic suppressor protein [Halorhabdus tiamatea SARL4B]|uniref:fructose-bisphosphatase n=1 Tax=Halorhabdus tiamatea SARL4B TaxID=1033806 RepID=F7PIS4_9EURY|nr:inositol monophosphatase [Halorhabdus tiamatea]ERJ05416.1 Extragenic suppressor protein [Halorhabdus tiamatea SARL4B]CCQ33357.1 inositol monophosphatase [Halorhabdus tiamatea SARL4B]
MNEIDEETAAGLRSIAREAAESGAEIACTDFREGIGNDFKRDQMDPVSRADREAQDRIVEILAERDPAAAIVGEENDAEKTVPDSGPAWIIDPIDGTNNFVRGNRLWGVSLARTVDGEPVAAATVLPAIGDTYTAGPGVVERNGVECSVSERTVPSSLIVAPIFGLKQRDRDDYNVVTSYIHEELGDLRRLGSGQTSMAMVACGEIDAAISTVHMTAWDTVAGAHMVRAGGGRVTDLAGDRWRHDSDSLVATNGEIHEDVLSALRDRLDWD